MSLNLNKTITLFLLLIIGILGYVLTGFETEVKCSNQKSLTDQRYKISEGLQTSARYLSKIAKLDACLDTKNDRKQKIHTVIKDLEIKATSYAFMNKVFFWISLIFAICIVVLPIVNSVTSEGSTANKIFSPTQLPAITLLAGLCFTLYTDYKGKQTSAENLIRYAYFSTDEIHTISKTVREGLAEIDGGQNFSSLIKK
jgi:preprotein translocase subunit SecG